MTARASESSSTGTTMPGSTTRSGSERMGSVNTSVIREPRSLSPIGSRPELPPAFRRLPPFTQGERAGGWTPSPPPLSRELFAGVAGALGDVRHDRVRRDDAEAALLVVLERLGELVARVHDERAVVHHRLV